MKIKASHPSPISKQLSSNTPVSQYLRMSKESQRYSLENQKTASRQYALKNHFEITKSYVDAGRSGLVLKSRHGLIQLLKDVVDGTHEYKAILVYDVSRWGRFQDVDESAYYEFICKRAGVNVQYCAESFRNDGTMPSAVMKALKRVMAGEYSRDLSDKVFNGAIAMVKRGFWHGSVPPYGLRRMLCTPTGEPKFILQDRQRKNIKEDRVKIVPGPANEIKWIREIFRLFTEERRSSAYIANHLNERGAPKKGRPWNYRHVLNILKDQKYIGNLVWGTRTKKLQSRDVPVPQDQWTIVPNVIKPILSRRVFNKAQARRRDLFPHFDSDEHLIRKLKPLLKREGRITQGIIDQCRSVPSSNYYAKRFGGLPRVYELLGCDKKMTLASRKRLQVQITKLYRVVLLRLRKVFGSQITVIRQRPKNRVKTVRFSNGFILSIAVCKHIKTSRGSSRWLFDNSSAKRGGHVTLLCFGNRANTQIKRYWLLPSIAHLAISSLLKEEDERLTTGKRLKRLSELKYLGIRNVRGEPRQKVS